MRPRSPVGARRKGRGSTGRGEVLLLRLRMLRVVVHGEGRVGGIRHRRLVLLVLLVELRVHAVVLVVVLEVLQMVLMVLVIGVELLRVGRRDRVLARDAVAGSLWLVDEGGHHGACSMEWG